MNRNILIFIAIGIGIAILLGGGLLFLNQQNTKSDSMMIKNDSSANEAVMKKDDAEKESMMDSTSNSKYIEYSSSALQSNIGNRVLFFYANWCPTCRPVDKELSSNQSKIPQDLTIIRVNYNDPETDQEEKDLAKKYNVTYQHTFVQIDEDGTEIKKWNGGNLEQIISNLN